MIISKYFPAVRHEKLNTPEHECEPSPDYSFAGCVQERLVREVGTVTIIITPPTTTQCSADFYLTTYLHCVNIYIVIYSVLYLHYCLH